MGIYGDDNYYEDDIDVTDSGTEWKNVLCESTLIIDKSINSTSAKTIWMMNL